MTDLRAKLEAVYKKKVEGSLTDTLRTVALDAFAGIGLATPVRSGLARANWNISVNTVDKTTTENTSQPDYIGEAQAATAGLKVTDTVYLTNNLPYIKRLNNGYSKQAPASFVEKAVLVAKNRAKRKIKTTVS